MHLHDDLSFNYLPECLLVLLCALLSDSEIASRGSLYQALLSFLRDKIDERIAASDITQNPISRL